MSLNQPKCGDSYPVIPETTSIKNIIRLLHNGTKMHFFYTTPKKDNGIIAIHCSSSVKQKNALATLKQGRKRIFSFNFEIT